MLGRKTFTQKELDDATTAIERQLAAYKKLAGAVEATGDAKAEAALAAFEPLFAKSLVLALDRRFVHRLRSVTGKDGNPLNELELLTASLMDHGGVLQGSSVIDFKPDASVLGLELGDRIEPSAADFGRLAEAVLADIDAKYV